MLISLQRRRESGWNYGVPIAYTKLMIPARVGRKMAKPRRMFGGTAENVEPFEAAAEAFIESKPRLRPTTAKTMFDIAVKIIARCCQSRRIRP
jgi:hypothetical protein